MGWLKSFDIISGMQLVTDAEKKYPNFFVSSLTKTRFLVGWRVLFTSANHILHRLRTYARGCLGAWVAAVTPNDHFIIIPHPIFVCRPPMLVHWTGRRTMDRGHAMWFPLSSGTAAAAGRLLCLGLASTFGWGIRCDGDLYSLRMHLPCNSDCRYCPQPHSRKCLVHSTAKSIVTRQDIIGYANAPLSWLASSMCSLLLVELPTYCRGTFVTFASVHAAECSAAHVVG
ncbi:hypothetical protein F5Y12DRAFT_155193 [Xylaria sp. FL1777]|nr:hypothetical protein F5Y12DRAFT_155193 [Xylaria sp. FL1777]